MKNLDPIRVKRQLGIITKWDMAKGKGTLEATTGFGKTICALLAMKQVREHNGVQAAGQNGYTVDTVIVVPTLYLQSQWHEKVKEWGFKSVQIWTVQSLVKKRGIRCKFFILDEIHMYASAVFKQVFQAVQYDWLLGLTATMPDDDIRRETITKYAPVVDTVTLEECERNNWTAPFIIYNLGIELNEEERELYNELNIAFGKFFGVFGHDFELAMACLSSKNRREEYGRQIQWDSDRLRNVAVNWNRNMRKRKELLYGSVTKMDAAHAICMRFTNAKIITFSQTIDSAEELHRRLGKESTIYHSKVKGRKFGTKYISAPKMLARAVDRFKDGDVRVLCTAKALDQGADIPEIDFGIVLSGTSKQRQALQRWGRTIRRVEGKSTRIVEVYAKDTQDEKWLRKRQIAAPGALVKYITSIDQII